MDFPFVLVLNPFHDHHGTGVIARERDRYHEPACLMTIHRMLAYRDRFS